MKRGKKKRKGRRPRRGHGTAAHQRAVRERAVGGITIGDLTCEGVLRASTAGTTLSGGRPRIRELLGQIEALRRSLEDRGVMRNDENDADRLAAALDGRLSDDERRLLRSYFATAPGSAEDVDDLREISQLLRRARGRDLTPPPRPEE